MTQTTTLVSRAFRKAGILAADEPLQGRDLANGLDALNMMIHSWRLDGVDLDFEDLTGTEEFPLASEYHEGVVYLLASRLFPEYMVPPSFDADGWFRSIQANNLVIPDATIETALQNMPSRFNRRMAVSS